MSIENKIEANNEQLMEAFGKDYHGTDDDMPDSYERWLAELTLEEINKIIK